MRLYILLVVFTAAHVVIGQAGDSSNLHAQTLVTSGLELPQGEMVREIDDPHSGARWLLSRDPLHPARPGRLVLAGGTRMAAPRIGTQEIEHPRPVIHVGDRLVVEENTAVVEARLEAVALGPAEVGSPLDVRLKIGGRVVRAMALGPGRAAFLKAARP